MEPDSGCLARPKVSCRVRFKSCAASSSRSGVIRHLVGNRGTHQTNPGSNESCGCKTEIEEINPGISFFLRLIGSSRVRIWQTQKLASFWFICCQPYIFARAW